MRKRAMVLVLMVWSWAALAGVAQEVERLLGYSEPPAGVVFEIVTGSPQGLEQAIPEVNGHIQRLRARFPGLPVAVVSHGREQFALMSDKRDTHPGVHDAVQSLVKDQDVPVHVCGTFASWYNVADEAFPDYVDVAAAGPVQIDDYQELGYVLITLD